MLVSFNAKATPTWQIPFPAITICPDSKSNADKFNLSDIMRRDSVNPDDQAALEAVAQVCDIINVNNLAATHQSYVSNLREISNEFYKISKIEIESSGEQNFSEFFHEVITEEGVCHTFNMLDAEDFYSDGMASELKYPRHGRRSSWAIYGYGSDHKPDTYPIRVLGSGVKDGVYIKLKMHKKDLDYACKKDTSGFRLVLHTPDEFPQPGSQFYQISFNTMSMINVQPKVMSTADEMRHYTPEKRQCFFEDDKKLKFYKHYAQANCKLERLASKITFWFDVDF